MASEDEEQHQESELDESFLEECLGNPRKKALLLKRLGVNGDKDSASTLRGKSVCTDGRAQGSPGQHLTLSGMSAGVANPCTQPPGMPPFNFGACGWPPAGPPAWPGGFFLAGPPLDTHLWLNLHKAGEQSSRVDKALVQVGEAKESPG